ncbi:glycosyltransferase family 2 protein [Scytonema sp. PCC 10023]|uniref:glycosyltransferase family 2 protein n=1 Tax=Scytonema sp. PCC 10023 TaxID=1680591 RepID=UPI0039C5E7ED
MVASVSTIIPCYRCSKTISRAIDSVAKQTLPPAEVILIDDGSGDDTLEVLLQLQRDYGKDWIKVVALKENSGPAVARNTAWDLAFHDYIAFLDSDDAWHPEKIAVQYSWMIQNPDIALSGHQVVLQKGKTQLNYEPVPSNIKSQKIDRNKILFSNNFCTSSVMMKRDIKQRFSPSLRYSQDYFLWLEIILEGSQASVLSFPIAYYFKYPFGEGGQTKNLLNGKAAEEEIYCRLWKSGAITFVEWRILCLWSLARYYRRVLICLLR